MRILRRVQRSILTAIAGGMICTLVACGGGGGGATGGSLPLIAGTGSWPPPVQLSTSTSCVTGALTAAAGAVTYNVGPGQTYADMGSVPWLSLKAGDVVNIFYRPQPYTTIVAITAIGTASAPIVINGVTDASCNRPVISGQNATIAADALASGYWTGNPGAYLLGDGLLNFSWAPGVAPSPATEPAYIIIQNLELTGAITPLPITGAPACGSHEAESIGSAP